MRGGDVVGEQYDKEDVAGLKRRLEAEIDELRGLMVNGRQGNVARMINLEPLVKAAVRNLRHCIVGLAACELWLERSALYGCEKGEGIDAV